MRTTTRMAAACAAAALTVLTATSAYADTVYNTLDASVDSTLETMDLQYDDVDSIAGAAGTTNLIVYAVDGDSHKGCNLPGRGVSLKLTADVTTVSPDAAADVAKVELANDGVIQNCLEPLAVTVTPLHSGTATVTFTGEISTSDNSNLNDFTYDGAAFTVNVVDMDLSTGGGGSGCDAEPAAPAWAAALLKGNNVKAKGTLLGSYISAVAAEMDQRAAFGGVQKIDQADYANAVYAWMTTADEGLHLTLTKGPADVAKPGWDCISF